MSAVVNQTGQIVIPAEVREKLGLQTGSVVDFEVSKDGRAYFKKSGDAAERVAVLERLVGTLKTDMTTDEIMALTRGDD